MATKPSPETCNALQRYCSGSTACQACTQHSCMARGAGRWAQVRAACCRQSSPYRAPSHGTCTFVAFASLQCPGCATYTKPYKHTGLCTCMQLHHCSTPVITITRIPACVQSLMASATSGLGGSLKPARPRKTMPLSISAYCDGSCSSLAAGVLPWALPSKPDKGEGSSVLRAHTHQRKAFTQRVLVKTIQLGVQGVLMLPAWYANVQG